MTQSGESNSQSAALLYLAEQLFPGRGGCAKCGFRLPYHEPSNHAYVAPVHPVVARVRELLEAVECH